MLDRWATLARSGGWWWPREDVCVVTERPVLVRTEAAGEARLGCTARPAPRSGTPTAVSASVRTRSNPLWRDVPPEGVELLRGEAGGNPHTLVADPGMCRWTTTVYDAEFLALGMFDTSAVAYLLHPEHGATGCAPGTYVVRRQREQQGPRARLIAD